MNISTKRLIIREYKKEDFRQASIFLMDKSVMHYITEDFDTYDEVEEFLLTNAHKYLVLEEKNSGEIIGHIYYEAFFGSHSYEIGWILKKEFQNLGYAYEAAYAVMDNAFKQENTHRIIATCQPENTGSWKLMEKLNMRREAEFKECIPFGLEWWDEYYYAILKKEWK